MLSRLVKNAWNLDSFIKEYGLEIEDYYDTTDCTQTWEEALEEDEE